MSVTLPLFEPELYHGSGPAYFGTLVRQPIGTGTDTRLRGKCYPVDSLTDWLRAVRHSPWDTYISQGEFLRDRCAVSMLKAIGLVWADIDNKHLARMDDAAAVGYILQIIDEIGIPAPSLIMASGNGYHVKWLFESAVPREDLMRWSSVEKAIASALKDIGADANATDAARVLRVAETTNQKNGFVARVVWMNYVNGEPLRHDFEDLAFEILPTPRILTPEEDARLGKAPKPRRAATGFSPDFTPQKLWWYRHNDIRKLCDLRGWARYGRGVPKGCRDLVLFICAVGVSYLALPGTWWREVSIMASELCPSLPRKEWEHFVRPTYKRLFEVRSVGKGRYRLSNRYIIDHLGITRDEMTHLKSIVAEDMAGDRRRESDIQRKARVRRSDEKRTAKAQRNDEARRMHAQGIHVNKIASELGISRRTVYSIIGIAES